MQSRITATALTVVAFIIGGCKLLKGQQPAPTPQILFIQPSPTEPAQTYLILQNGNGVSVYNVNPSATEQKKCNEINKP